MDINAIIKRAIAILTKPNDEWQTIKSETMTVADIFTKYAIWLAAIPAIAGFLGYFLFIPLFGITAALKWAIFTFILSLAGTYVIGLIIDVLAPSFGAQKDIVQSMKVAGFAFTASWLGGIIYLIPSISILGILAFFYTLYLLYLGVKIIKEPSQDKLIGYLVTIIIVAFIVYFIAGLITARIAFGVFGSFLI